MSSVSSAEAVLEAVSIAASSGESPSKLGENGWFRGGAGAGTQKLAQLLSWQTNNNVRPVSGKLDVPGIQHNVEPGNQ